MAPGCRYMPHSDHRVEYPVGRRGGCQQATGTWLRWPTMGCVRWATGHWLPVAHQVLRCRQQLTTSNSFSNQVFRLIWSFHSGPLCGGQRYWYPAYRRQIREILEGYTKNLYHAAMILLTAHRPYTDSTNTIYNLYIWKSTR